MHSPETLWAHRNPTMIGATLVVAIMISSAVFHGAAPATANEYPSWAEVESARASETTKREQIAELEAQLASLAEQTAAAEKFATQRGEEYELAQAKFDDANLRAGDLRTQSDEAAARADASARQAGQVAAMLARSTSADLGMRLVMDADADGLLKRLGSMSKLSEQTAQISRQAITDRNAAATLAEQASLARDLRGQRAADSERALEAAVEAQAALQVALDRTQENETTMRAQLTVLIEDRVATEADYTKGAEVRAAAEAAERAAREAAAGAGGGSPFIGGQGWALPISGPITSPFGPRPDLPVPGVNPYHYATDIAAGCGRPVAAASAGTVVYAGWLGSYGNWVLIDHGNGVQTGYAHNSNVLVGTGQSVEAGATIAEVGTTGASTGCHVHYEVRVDGARIDPAPFMRDRGVTLG